MLQKSPFRCCGLRLNKVSLFDHHLFLVTGEHNQVRPPTSPNRPALVSASTRVSLGILGPEISIWRTCFENTLQAEIPITAFAFSTRTGNWSRPCNDSLDASNLERSASESSWLGAIETAAPAVGASRRIISVATRVQSVSLRGNGTPEMASSTEL
jgi:hypothetical protein